MSPREGIGLVLSCQIAEAHGGALPLRNRDDGADRIARLVLPRATRRAGGSGRQP